MFSSKQLALVVVIFFVQAKLIFSDSDCVHGNLYAHSSSCSLFFHCIDGKLFELHCPNGLYFNPTKDLCDWPGNVSCDKNTAARASPKMTTELTPSTTAIPEICRWRPGQEIAMGNRCVVPDGLFVFQEDGNAVIYDLNNVPLWNTETAGLGHRFVFQSDGNLVMYDVSGTAVWNSQTHDQDATLLIFQQDRNLVIYKPKWVALWNSRTFVPTTTVAPTTTTPTPTTTTPTTTSPTPTRTTPTTTTWGPPNTPTPPAPEICRWAPGQEIVMGRRCDVPSGYFVFQEDGNAVIYDRNHEPLWHTVTTGLGNYLLFQEDGNLVMYSSSGAVVWNSGTQNQGGSLLIFQPDRNLVIYNEDRVSLWNTGTTVV